MRLTLLLIFCINAIACSSIPQKVTPVNVPLMASLALPIAFQLENDREVDLELGVIPGNIYGAPLDKPHWTIDIFPSQDKFLDVANLALTVKPFAKTFKNDFLDVEPKETKLARISTLGLLENAQHKLSGSFSNAEGDYMILVYFDRACSVKGDIDFGKHGIYYHDFKIENPGLHWLIIENNGNSNTLHTALANIDQVTARIGF